LGKDHIITARAYWSLGYIYYGINDYEKAYSYSKNAYIIYKNIYGNNHKDTINILNNMNIY
jgi:hypothetical protein